MSKNLKNLIIGAAVILVLGGALLALLLTQGKGDGNAAAESSSSEALSAKALVEKTPADIVTIEVKNKTGSYTVARTGEEYAITSYTANGETKTPSAATKYEQPNFIAMANAVTSLVQLDGTVSDDTTALAKYGLDNPTVATAKYTDGTQFTVKLGKDAPDDKSTYAIADNAEGIILVSKYTAAALYNPVEYFIATTLVPAIDEQTQPAVTNMSFGGTLRANEIVLVPDPNMGKDNNVYSSGYLISSPKSAMARYNTMNAIFKTFWGSKATTAVCINPTPEKLTEYGLDVPYSTMSINYEGRNVTVKLGKKTADGYYAITSENDAVLQVTPDNVPWADVPEDKFYDNLILMPSIFNVKQVIMELDGKTYTFEIESEEKTIKAAKCNGKELDTEAFRVYYQNMISVIGEELVGDQAVSTTPLIKYTYVYKPELNMQNDVLEILPITDRISAISANGDKMFTIRSKYVEKMRSDLPIMLEGTKVSTDW